MRLAVKFVLSVVFGGVCLWLTFRHVSFGRFAENLAGFDGGWIGLAFLTFVLNYLLRAFIWKAMLATPVTLRHCMSAMGASYLFNNILPLRLGDVMRTLALRYLASVPTLRIIGSLTLERIADASVMLVTLAAILVFVVMPGGVIVQALQLAGLVALAILIVIAVVVFGGRVLAALGLDHLAWMHREFSDGILVVFRPRVLATVSILVAVNWGLAVLTYYFVLRAYLPSANLIEAAVLTCVLVVALAVPSAPGSVGLFQLAGQMALVLPFAGKYDGAIALAAVTMGHFVYLVCTTAIGLFSMWHLRDIKGFGMMMTEMRQKSRGAIRMPSPHRDNT